MLASEIRHLRDAGGGCIRTATEFWSTPYIYLIKPHILSRLDTIRGVEWQKSVGKDQPHLLVELF